MCEIFESGRGDGGFANGLQGIQKANILNLPMTDEVRLERTLELSFEHYRAVMGGKK